MNWFLNNREIIKNLAINTGTTEAPVFTAMCTTSEIEFTTDFETTDFYVFCDAIKRKLVTGSELGLDTTVKLDVNNAAIQNVLTKIHTLLQTGDIAQFNGQTVQFDLLSGVSDGVLEYTKYQVPVTLIFSDLGGPAEEEGEFGLEISIQGTAEEVTE